MIGKISSVAFGEQPDVAFEQIALPPIERMEVFA